MTMRRLKNMSVRQRLAWLVLIASLLALLCVIGAVLVYEETTSRPAAEEQLRSEAVILQEALRATLEFNDNDTARRYLETRRVIPELAVAALYEKDWNVGRLFAEYHRPDVNVQTLPTIPAPAGAYFTPRQLTLWQPVRKDGKLIGHLVLMRDLPPWYRRLPQYFIMFAAVSGALVLVGVTIQLGVNRHFLRPLVSLVNTTSQVIQKNDYNVRAAVRRDDELGRLAQAFNQMLARIDHSLAENGERKVQLR
ncbi:MAG: HAMP domain-containing protein [Pedosphaera sp.]|nr:HAMP domain-containing protein [Pedosphaera sp.]